MIALLVDIGNSRIKWRIARIDASSSTPHWITAPRALALADCDAFADALDDDAEVPVEASWCSNVASDAVADAVKDAIAARWSGSPIHAVRSRAHQCGVVNGYRDPVQLGPDRWLAMIGAHVQHPRDTLLVCTFGTATTIDLVVARAQPTLGEAARFVGGLILPGIDAMGAALASSTARLPRATGQIVDFATNTDDAITSGIVAAQRGAVERAVGDARRTSHPVTVCVVAGGGAARMAPLLSGLDVPVVVAHDLVLLGLATIAGPP